MDLKCSNIFDTSVIIHNRKYNTVLQKFMIYKTKKASLTVKLAFDNY